MHVGIWSFCSCLSCFFYVLLTVCVVVFIQWHFIGLFSCWAASLFNKHTCLAYLPGELNYTAYIVIIGIVIWLARTGASFKVCSQHMNWTEQQFVNWSLVQFSSCAVNKSLWVIGVLAGIGWLGSRVVSVLDSGAEGPGSNRSCDAVG